MAAADDLTVAALLVSRLCHDLAAPAGAVHNGIEMLRDPGSPDDATDAVDLLEFSATETLRRLEFFRLAFGAAGGLGAPVETAEARRAASGFFADRKADIAWPDAGPDRLAQTAAKLVLNLVLLAAEALMKGGTVKVTVTSDRVSVVAEGEDVRFPPERAAALAGETPVADLGARIVQPWFAGALARAHGGAVTVEKSEQRAAFSAPLPAAT